MLENKDYIGKVIYNNDPTYSGRCKIRVMCLFDELDDEHIPWFVPMNSPVFSGNGFGSLSIPKVDDIVRVRFVNNDLYSGEYTSIQNIDPLLIDEIKDDYEGTQVLLYDSTEDLMVIFKKKSGIKISLRGSTVRIGADGIIQLQHQNNTNVIEITQNDINIAGAGAGCNINIAAGNKVMVTSPEVSIESNNVKIGSGASSPAVKGDELVSTLMEIAALVDAKYPQSYTLSSRTFSEILSDSVKIS